MSNKKHPKISNTLPIYRVGIVGAGRIGSGFDAPRSIHTLTHAHAIVDDPRLSLVGITDVDSRVGMKEAKRWGTKFFPDLKSMLAIGPDIVVIATPDHTHAPLLGMIAEAGLPPRLVICEKPVAVKRSDRVILARFARKKIPVLVNFSRRFDTALVSVCTALNAGTYGKVIAAHAHYTNGLLHNGAHMIDLGRYFFGEITSSRGLFRIFDRSLTDPSVSGVATFERCPQFFLLAGDEREYAISDFDILTQKAHIHFDDYQFSVRGVMTDPLYSNFRILSPAVKKKTKLLNSIPRLYSHATLVLDGKEKPVNSLEDALATQEACLRLLDSSK